MMQLIKMSSDNIDFSNKFVVRKTVAWPQTLAIHQIPNPNLAQLPTNPNLCPP